jgi:DNA invertase Pin-like site-specific DNA recombinase
VSWLISFVAEYAFKGEEQYRDRSIQSLSEDLDTISPDGRLVFHIFGAIAEFERDLIRERTRAGLDAARHRGRVGGRPRSMASEKLDAAKKLLAAGTPPKDVAESLSVSVPTIYRWLPAAAR